MFKYFEKKKILDRSFKRKISEEVYSGLEYIINSLKKEWNFYCFAIVYGDVYVFIKKLLWNFIVV